ncbi:ribonuclease H-like [Dunckerocampus dactyliophorus]|uniref:ribonuclease H-like n=1 Tax=Dunckerocampus dactyliophorus TaxID=161453 RepID=UPI002407619D|nr:ribonuclease H-like [Dunckerocampus dactyliophorus]
MTALRQSHLLRTLQAPNIQFIHSGVNMADSISASGTPHECALQVSFDSKVRPDLQTKPLSDGLVLFTDGCCFRSPSGDLHAASAVVQFDPVANTFHTVCTDTAFSTPSAQAAELRALVLALCHASGAAATVFSDSAYAVSAACCDLPEWRRCGYMTARGQPIAHREIVEQLAEALLLPSRVAIVKTAGHSKAETLQARGNAAADLAAKAAAGYLSSSSVSIFLASVASAPPLAPPLSLELLRAHQASASPEERSFWLSHGARRTSDGLIVGRSVS